MMERETAKSPFQMRDWRIVKFDYSNDIMFMKPNPDITWQFLFERQIQYDDDNKCYSGTLHIHYSASALEGDRKMAIDGDSYSFFTFETDQATENETRMESLLKLNGLTYSIGMLRNFIASQSTVLGMRTHLILPSINLRNVEYGEVVTIQ